MKSRLKMYHRVFLAPSCNQTIIIFFCKWKLLMRFLIRFCAQKEPFPTLHECIFAKHCVDWKERSHILWRYPYIVSCSVFKIPPTRNFPRICMPDIHNLTLVSDFTFQPLAGGSHASSSIPSFTSSWQSSFRNVAGGLDFDAYLFHNRFWLGRQKLHVCGLHPAQLFQLDGVTRLVRMQVMVSTSISRCNLRPGSAGLNVKDFKVLLHCKLTISVTLVTVTSGDSFSMHAWPNECQVALGSIPSKIVLLHSCMELTINIVP